MANCIADDEFPIEGMHSNGNEDEDDESPMDDDLEDDCPYRVR